MSQPSTLSETLLRNKIAVVEKTLARRGVKLRRKCAACPPATMELKQLEAYLLEHCPQRSFRRGVKLVLKSVRGWFVRTVSRASVPN